MRREQEKRDRPMLRNLANYKAMHRGTAVRKGVLKEFEAAQSLTKARGILFGFKRGSR